MFFKRKKEKWAYSISLWGGHTRQYHKFCIECGSLLVERTIYRHNESTGDRYISQIYLDCPLYREHPFLVKK